MNSDMIVCGVDNTETRIYTSKWATKHSIPAVFTAVSENGGLGYVFVQEPGKACFGCAFPASIGNVKEPCPGVPAIKDILKLLSGFSLYAIDSLLMDRKRNWNLRVVYLAGFVPDVCRIVSPNPECPLCGGIASTGNVEIG